MSQELKIAWGVVGSLLTGLLEARKYEDSEAYQTRLAEFEEANNHLLAVLYAEKLKSKPESLEQLQTSLEETPTNWK